MGQGSLHGLVGLPGWRERWSRVDKVNSGPGGAKGRYGGSKGKGSKVEGAMRGAKAQALLLPGCITLSKAPNLSESYFPPLEM